MPLIKQPAAEALTTARENSYRNYPSPKRGGERLYPVATPMPSPGFTFSGDDRIFAMGSCFARNVERALMNIGFDVLSQNLDLGKIGASLKDEANFYNKYNIFTMLNELNWAFDRETFDAEKTIYKLKGSKLCDLQLGMPKLDFPFDEVVAFRHRYLDSFRQIADAELVVITLGLAEAWFDRELGVYTNLAPPTPLIELNPGRFEFHVLDYNDILAGLDGLYAKLKAVRQKPLRMLVTVSPVPLLSTFRSQDVIVANTYSKAVQRAAVEAFVLDKPDVDYFPSYEFVTQSSPEMAWSRDDYRHVSGHIVRHIMSHVVKSYVGEELVSEAVIEAEIEGKARAFHQSSNVEGVISVLEPHMDLVRENINLMFMLARAYRRKSRHAECYDLFAMIHLHQPNRPLPLESMISLCRPLGRLNDVDALLKKHADTFPDRAEFRERFQPSV